MIIIFYKQNQDLVLQIENIFCNSGLSNDQERHYVDNQIINRMIISRQRQTYF